MTTTRIKHCSLALNGHTLELEPENQTINLSRQLRNIIHLVAVYCFCLRQRNRKNGIHTPKISPAEKQRVRDTP